jgi:topoisomerase IV subunit B
MIFITEGQSAAGSIVSCRDVNTQAIFTLKGKPLNVCDLKRDALYKNDELYNLMRSLDIEETVDTCATRRSSSPPTPTWTACTSATC